MHTQIRYTNDSVVDEVVARKYSRIHVLFNPTLCLFGLVYFVVTVIVLNQIRRSTAITTFLMALAITFGLSNSFYIPYSIHVLYIVFFDSFIHSITDQLIVMYCPLYLHSRGLFACLAAGFPWFLYLELQRSNTKNAFTALRARLFILYVSVISTIVSIPTYMVYSQMTQPTLFIGHGAKEWFASREGRSLSRSLLFKLHFVTQAGLLTITPGLAFFIVTILLTKRMRKAIRLRQFWTYGLNRRRSSSKRKDPNQTVKKTSKLLMEVGFVFVTTELTVGGLLILAVFTRPEYSAEFLPYGDLLSSVALMGEGLTFLLYNVLSKRFRDSFWSIFNYKIPGRDFCKKHECWDS